MGSARGTDHRSGRCNIQTIAKNVANRADGPSVNFKKQPKRSTTKPSSADTIWTGETMRKTIVFTFAALLSLAAGAMAADVPVLVEAESFKDPGGWVLDTQFVQIMGSPYLMAHGLGVPVKDATATVAFPSPGTYKVFVRTKDWVATWKAPGAPGKFQLDVNGKALPVTFGTEGADWHWQPGGEVTIDKTDVTLALHDLTGFEGRCDAICFDKDPAFVPPNEPKELASWRKKTLGLPDKPVDAGPFDLVVVGGGYSGMGAAIAGARMGCKVALIQDRPVLGGNGSSEVRVWSQGGTTLGKYPRIGEIVEEFADNAKDSPGTEKEFGDEKKEAIVRNEQNIALFLNTQAFAVEMKDGRIAAVIGHDMRSGAETRFVGKLFSDTTGHGTIGALAGADFDELEKGHMGMSNMWRWDMEKGPETFPDVSAWALPLKMADFPYPNRGKAEWFWEGGFNRDPIKDLEYIRDWNFRAIYGAFNAMKNGDGKDKHADAKLEWIAYIGGNRESRLLRGDLVLTREDIINKKEFEDGFVPSTWSIDLHTPKEQYAKKFPDDPFISKAVFDSRVDKKNGYPIPYRCFYSRNITNLFMAGRDISVDHGALGTVRVMRTCGMEGEVVGKAASVCVKDDCLPRDVYYSHLNELKELLNLPGQARRNTVADKIDPNAPLPDIASHRAPRRMPGGGEKAMTGVDPKTLAGIIVDTDQVKLTGEWTPGSGLKGFIGKNYLYSAEGKEEKSARFEFKVPASGQYEVRFAIAPHEKRATNVAATVISKDGNKAVTINERAEPPLNGFVSLGTFHFDADTAGAVEVNTKGADGTVAVNAIQVLPAK
jgi:hypothetical protein